MERQIKITKDELNLAHRLLRIVYQLHKSNWPKESFVLFRMGGMYILNGYSVSNVYHNKSKFILISPMFFAEYGLRET